MGMSDDEAARFWPKVDKRGDDECWLWLGSLNSKGYPLLRVRGSARLAHRLSYETYVAPIDAGASVCHSCDTPRCVNPRHLWAGSHADNMGDMHAKGRGAVGSLHGSAKLTEEQVANIRASRDGGAKLREIAARYGIAESTACQIARGQRWRHV